MKGHSMRKTRHWVLAGLVCAAVTLWPPMAMAAEYEMTDQAITDADEVTVTVDDGTATLTGTVDSWSEYWSARENAFEGGAVWVDNDLNVE